MEWMTDPTGWAGLATLVLLELILGIDNLIFIAILAQKLPPHQRDRARQVGLLLALGMRIVLLFSISWLASLTAPLFAVLGKEFSGRDLILLLGGVFLLWKATHEIHTRIEGRGNRGGPSKFKVSFGMVIAQIVVLDAVFSLDAVITAVGMTEHLSLMIVAVTIAILLMIWTSKPLTAFVNRHPTVVMLCLGFLLMVGFSLIAEGMGADIPKGYLYAAIGFSVMIEAINQFAQRKLKLRVKSDGQVKQKTADAILRLLGAKPLQGVEESQEASAVLQEAARLALTPAEKELLRGVLNLSERTANTIMTPRMDVEWVDLRQDTEEIFEEVKRCARSHLLVVDGELDNVLGILRKDDFLVACLGGEDGVLDLDIKLLHEPLFVQKRTPVMTLLEIFKRQPVELAVVVNENGGVEGVVTHLDLLEAIAGEFPDRDEPEALPMVDNGDGSLTVDGLASIYDVRNRLGLDYEPDGRFATMSGLILHELGRVPSEGDEMEWHGWHIRVVRMEGRRVDEIVMRRVEE